MNPAYTLILNSAQIERKLQRIAREIVEQHHETHELVLIGIEGQGQKMCDRLEVILKEISSIRVQHEKITLHKDAPLDHDIHFTGNLEELAGKAIVVVDDVLNSGRTLIYAVKHLLDFKPKTMHTAVLIDRFHRAFPVRADFCGLTLSTTVKEHIEVEFSSDGQDAAYLKDKDHSSISD
jgi:pyrimidine operon attenuation protein/uracil phosphoribosyltransferase